MVSYYSDSGFSSFLGASVHDKRAGTVISYSEINSTVSLNSTTSASSIVWRGKIRGPSTGTVTFRLVCEGGASVSVDGVSKISQLANTGSLDTTFTVTMTLNAYYSIELRYVPDNGSHAVYVLYWKYTSPLETCFTAETCLIFKKPMNICYNTYLTRRIYKARQRNRS